jgi:4-hydroxybenzoate polyprenyltransferase
MNSYEDYENESYENYEDFQMGTVCNAFSYSVNLFGYRVNIWVLLLVVAVLLGALFYQQNKRLPTFSDVSLSSTSSMGDIAKQMGGFAATLSDTPNFIKNLNFY